MKGKPDPEPWRKVKKVWDDMFDVDIVIVNAAGNKGDFPGRSDVDTVPTKYANDDFPLIVASAVDNDGNLPR